MGTLRFRAVLFIALSITILGLAVFLATLVPEGIYPYGERLRDYALFAQGIVAAVAIGAGAYVADRRFQIFRTFQPHLTIAQEVTHRQLSESYIHIEVTVILKNSSRVHVELRRSLAIIQEVAPISDEEAEAIYEGGLNNEDDPSYQWPTITRTDRVWGENELIVEPGEQHAETFEFVIEGWENQTVLLYTYFYNEHSGQDAGAGEGWAATTVYDVR